MSIDQTPAAEPQNRLALVVLGMHRSGTSALSGALSLLGPRQPLDIMPPQADNPFGFWESIGVRQLNDRILSDLGTSWDRPLTIVLPGEDAAASRPQVCTLIRERYLADAVKAIEAAYRDQGAIVVKDPRICLFPGLWVAALRQAGYAPRFLFIYRNPLEVAGSLKARNDIGPARAQQLWLRYTLSALGFLSAAGHDVVMATYEALLGGRGRYVAKLAAEAGVAPPADGPEADRAIDMFLQADARHHQASNAALTTAGLVPNLCKRLYTLLQEWDLLQRPDRESRLNTLAELHDDYVRFAGQQIVMRTPPASHSATAPAAKDVAQSGRRLVLLHYHLFKNAGTSMDAILKRNFGDRWQNIEFPSAAVVNHQDAIGAFVLENAHLAAVSSHTLNLPPPELADVELFPIIFVREPLARLRSVYAFERQQQAATYGAKLAKEHDFPGYLKARLSSPGDRSCRDFQTFRLAMAVPGSFGSECDRARAALERLPFVGLVEAFGKSVQVLEGLLRPRLPQFHAFDTWENATSDARQNREPVQDTLRDQLGDQLYERVVAANQSDIQLYEMVRQRYGA